MTSRYQSFDPFISAYNAKKVYYVQYMYNIHHLEKTTVVGVLQLKQSQEVALNQMRWRTMFLTKLMKCHMPMK